MLCLVASCDNLPCNDRQEKFLLLKRNFVARELFKDFFCYQTQPSVSSTCADSQDASFVSFLLHSFFELLNVTFIKKKINANECFSISSDNLTFNPQIIIIIIIINHHIMAY